MRPATKVLGLAGLILSVASLAYGATISGTVKGPDGKSFKGAFVAAQNLESRITVNVLSDKDGRYRVENLPEGQYQLMVRAVGYRFEPRMGINLTSEQNASYEIALEKGTVHWTDLSIYQGAQLLPDGPGRDRLTTTCFGCHGFQSRMAAQVRDETGWRDRVNYMRTSFGYLLGKFNDEDRDNVTAYLTKYFGPDSPLPHSPAEMPKYEQVKQAPFSDDAMKMVYVTYELPGANRKRLDLGVSRALVWEAGPKDRPNHRILDTRRRSGIEPYRGDRPRWHDLVFRTSRRHDRQNGSGDAQNYALPRAVSRHEAHIGGGLQRNGLGD